MTESRANHQRRVRACVVACALLVVSARSASAAVPNVSFATGSLIIPMDVDYQDVGMLKAFGLLDKLLRAGVSVAWCIKTPKTVVDAASGRFEDDFTASATDLKSNAIISQHGYRGGPFVIAAADAPLAMPVITAWQATITTAVHVATAPFTAPVSRTLTAAPRIAILADGHESIAFSYLNAAGILDEDNKTWSLNSRSVVTPTQVAGPTTTSHKDGVLFRPSGEPAFCEIMTMHWSVNDSDVPEVSAEMGEFLKFPVHLNAECQAVNAIEGAPPAGGRMKFVAPQGFVWPAPKQPPAVEYANSSLPFAQQDGPFGTVGGSEPAYALPAGSAYYDSGIVMVRALGEAPGTRDIWMTGYAGGACKIDEGTCQAGSKGKVSYLGGHQYTVKTPMTANKTSQGTRLFLNSLYEAGCVTTEGQPSLTLNKSGPDSTTSADVSWEIVYVNGGEGPALDVVVTDTLPAGATFVSASNGGTFANGTVTWNVGDVGSNRSGILTVTVQLGSLGAYVNRAGGRYGVGLSSKTVQSNDATTVFTQAPDGGAADAATPDASPDASSGCANGCPAPANACQRSVCMGAMCVVMDDDGKLCTPADRCVTGGTCLAGACQGGVPAVCAPSSNPCQKTSCDPQLGCRFVPDKEGQLCDDGDACTTATTCTAGECVGGAPVICPQSMCSPLGCDPSSGCPAPTACPADGGIAPGGDAGGGTMSGDAGFAEGGTDGGMTMPGPDGGQPTDSSGGAADRITMTTADSGSTPDGSTGPDSAGSTSRTDGASTSKSDGGSGADAAGVRTASNSGCSCTTVGGRTPSRASSTSLLLLGLVVARAFGRAKRRRTSRPDVTSR
jgi:uncharacterized repeat protein (TIGR01451 family)